MDKKVIGRGKFLAEELCSLGGANFVLSGRYMDRHGTLIVWHRTLCAEQDIIDGVLLMRFGMGIGGN